MLPAMQVIAIPCLQDNYAYLMVSDKGSAAVVDPSEAAPVWSALEKSGARLSEIWLTHHHLDHVGGVEELCDRAQHAGLATALEPLPVFGSAYDLTHARIPRQTRGLQDGDHFSFDGADVSVLAIPGHTLGAIAYVTQGALFSGDTLFVAGCGRVFEGTMPMMQASLDKLRALPGPTRLYCGHEYTEANLRFVEAIDPDAPGLSDAIGRTRRLRSAGQPTVPSTLEAERSYNPFLRWDAPSVISSARARGAVDASPATVFGTMRGEKDRFR
jgi:hydroxyacylglutathione hydrolase